MRLCPLCRNEFPDDFGYCHYDGSALTPAPVSDPLVGGLFLDRYRLRSRLGSGRSSVYLADDIQLRRDVAIKVVETFGDASEVARIKREAQLATRVRHRNICIVHDLAAISEDRWFLIMEPIIGDTVRGRLEKHRQL